MLQHPIALDMLVRARIETLREERRWDGSGGTVERGDAAAIRTWLGLRLIALGERLAGSVAPDLGSARPA